MQKRRRHLCLFLLLLAISSNAQVDTLRIATYNILNFPGSTGTARLPELRIVLNEIQPDILVVQELLSASGQDTFLNDILNHSKDIYQAVDFNDGPDTDNGLFYRHDKVSIVATSQIGTQLRDISEYVLAASGEEFRIYSVHLKAGSGSTDQTRRTGEVTILRNHLNNLTMDTNFIVLGDFNMRASTETAFIRLTEAQTDNDGRLFDPINQPGTWHDNSSFAGIHTQSPRKTQFGGGASGGMDDRFDLLLVSNSLLQPGGMDVLVDSHTSFGNDGNHLNLAINDGANGAVADSVANALHAARRTMPL